jgi:hypothetical protein
MFLRIYSIWNEKQSFFARLLVPNDAVCFFLQTASKIKEFLLFFLIRVNLFLFENTRL